MLGNGLLPLLEKEKIKSLPYITMRAEQLGWEQFVELTNAIEEGRK